MVDALSPGIVVAGTYEVERLLGRGGMGEVWLARHQRLQGKQVAIKVLRTQGALPTEALARFKREAEIAVRLEHPNIVQVLDFNSLPSGEPFIVMELLKGESLGARLKRGPLTPDEASQVMRQVGSALHAAHVGGVVHRDLKPENIFLVPTALGDQVKVLDFGISKLGDGGTMQTTDSVLMGTPLYMSPEQALGHNRDVTPQSDVFSLGSIVYECLTGKAPFEADNIAKVVFRIAYEPHAPLQTLAPHVPEVMAKAVEHALKKDRAARTPSVAAFVLELTGQVLSDGGTRSPAASHVLQPGEQVDEQMMAEATVAPSLKNLPRSELATPNGSVRKPPLPEPPATPTTPPARSPLTLVLGGLAVVVIGVGTYLGVRGLESRSGEDAGAPVQVPLDAGAVVIDAGLPVIDAGAEPSAVADDAGAVAPLDAGSEPAPKDAGVKAPKLVPPSPEDAERLAQLVKSFQTDEDESWAARAKLPLQFQSPGGRREMTMLLVEIACKRADITNAQVYSRQVPDGVAKEQARKRCRKYQPAWELD